MITETFHEKSKSILTLGVMVAALIVGTVFLKNNFDNRQQASTLTGPAKFTFQSTTGTTLRPGTAETIAISASGTGASNVDGFQLIAHFTGTVPTITVEPTQFTQLNAISSSITDTTNGKRLILAFITKDPATPFNPNNDVVPLAKLHFTVPANGNMTLSVDETTSKILQSVTGTNLLGVSPATTFTFVNPSSPTPNTVPTPIVATSPSPVATILPTPSLRPIIYPTLLPSSVPSVPSTPPVVADPGQCLNKFVKITPYPDTSKWTTTGQFLIQNIGTSTTQFNWALNAESNPSLNKTGSETLAPQQSVTLGLGKVCSKWTLNLGCGSSNHDKGYTVESNPAACVTPTTAPNQVPHVSPLPTPVPTQSLSWIQKLLLSIGRIFKGNR